MSREIVWTAVAETDAQKLFAWLFDHSGATADRFLASVIEQTDLLCDFPEMASIWHPPIRRLIIPRTRFGLFYVVHPRRVIVIAVQDLRRDPRQMHEEITGRLP